MNTTNISVDTPFETVLAIIEEEVKNTNTKYIQISFLYDYPVSQRKKVVEEIKKYFDVFIILKTEIPQNKHEIEEFFSYGVHGVYFINSSSNPVDSDLHILHYALELFTPGWVFTNSTNNKTIVDKLLMSNIVPVVTIEDEMIKGFIKSHKNYGKIASSLIKAVPLLDKEQPEYSLGDKVKMKMLLESLNFRQKLMIKSVEDSLTSSGL